MLTITLYLLSPYRLLITDYQLQLAYMVIGIDITPTIYGTGVSVYTKNLVENLVTMDTTNTYKLFFSSLRQPLPAWVRALANNTHVKVYHFRLPPSFLEKLVWPLLPIEVFIGHVDLLHVWEAIPAKTRANRIVTIHDLAPILYPETCHPQTVKRYQTLLASLNKYSHIIAVSHNTKQDLLSHLPDLNPKKISVIHEASGNAFSAFLSQTSSNHQALIQEAKKVYSTGETYFLAVGTREPRKNLNRLVLAYASFVSSLKPTQRVPNLVIVGRYGWGEDVRVPQTIQSKIKLLGFVPNGQLAPLYAGAVAFVFPSLYEGFGIPPLEAMTLSCPVITSNTGPLPEVVGNAALLVDPLSQIQLTLALQRLWQDYLTNQTLRKKLITKGLAQAKVFSWHTTAKQTLAVYQSLKVL